MKTEATIQQRESMKLKPGMTVTIYHDPLSQKTPEGEAVLKRLVRADDECPRWSVQFVGEDRQVERIVSNWKWKRPDDTKSKLLARALAFALLLLGLSTLTGCYCDDRPGMGGGSDPVPHGPHFDPGRAPHAPR
ncbi:MAG TPA: hypothetical protein VN281_14840 [Verrucomicrobiae bacterium]|jgi:hypothetical protein|nr:hypothetical protein [Verrucomicrobiae bacterium]